MEIIERIKGKEDFVLDELVKYIPYIDSASGQNLVVLLGNTGVGKTTCFHSLAAHKLRKNKFGEIETVEETDFKISHAAESETVFAKLLKTYSPSDCQPISLVDTAGFDDNRYPEFIVVSSMSLELLIQNGISKGEVKAFLIVIPYRDLEAARSPMTTLVQSLNLLFQDPVKMLQYSFILIVGYNDDEDAAKIRIDRKLDYLIEFYHKKYNTLKHFSSFDGLNVDDCIRIIEFLKAIQNSKDRIIIFDPLDKGKSRQLVFEKLKKIEPSGWYLNEIKNKYLGSSVTQQLTSKITVKDFNFSTCNPYRRAFNGVINGLTVDGSGEMKFIEIQAKTYLELTSGIPDCENRLSALVEFLPNLQQELQNSTSERVKNYCDNLKRWYSKIAKMDETIKKMSNQLAEEIKAKKKLLNELREIDNDNEVLYLFDDMEKSVWFFNFLGFCTKKFCFNTYDDSVEFVRIEKKIRNGKLYDEVDKSETGYYSCVYKSDYYPRPAYVYIATYVKSRFEPGNKRKIEQIRNTLNTTNEKIVNLESEINDLAEEKQHLKNFIGKEECSFKSDKENLKRIEADTKTKIEVYKEKIEKMKKDKTAARCLGLEALNRFYRLKDRLDMLVKIADVIKFETNLVKNFVVEYREFLIHLDDYKNNFNEDSWNITSFIEEKDYANDTELLDPITKNPIMDLVVTPAGTAFDLVSLLQQYHGNPDPPPFLYEHPNGTVEEILYYSWQKVDNIQNYMDNLRHKLSYKNPESHYCSLYGIESMSAEELEKQAETLETEIQDLKEKIAVKETILAKVQTQLNGLRSDTESANSENIE